MLYQLADIGQLAKQSVDSMGPGAYLVSLLPSATLIVSLIAIFTSHLFPGSAEIHAKGSLVPPGPAAVAFELGGLNPAEDALLVIGIVVGAVLLRPFQVSVDQFLEGYWREHGRRRSLRAFATERHRRRWTIARWRMTANVAPPVGIKFGAVASYERDRGRQERFHRQGARVTGQYPTQLTQFMPTRLGNILRRWETSAGERYGLVTISAYPRLYPHIGDRLDRAISAELDMLDTMSTFTFVFAVLTGASVPIAVRLDPWTALPIGLLLATALCYRAAILAANRYGELVATAFDLHRFDMVAAMHRPLPRNLDVELAQNEALSKLFQSSRPFESAERRTWNYKHPSS